MRAISRLWSLVDFLLSLQLYNSGYIFHSYGRWLHTGVLGLWRSLSA